MLPQDWTPHRRSDGEVVGWIAPEGDDFVAIDLLGRPATDGPVDWIEAEEALDARGIGYLADPWWFGADDGTERPVRIGEATTERIVVVADDFGAASVVGAEPETIVLPFPAPASLRPR